LVEKTKTGLTDWEELVKGLAGDRRGSKRVNLICAIEISGIDRLGVSFSERTATQDISEFGCRIQTALPLERGDVVALKLLVNGETVSDEIPHFFEIVWTVNNATGRSVGARKIQGKKIWKIDFPKPSAKLPDDE
jgi:hypothetical protein